MKTGDQIQINKGLIETLIEISHPYGLFLSTDYSVVRNMAKIQEKEIIGSIHATPELLKQNI